MGSSLTGNGCARLSILEVGSECLGGSWSIAEDRECQKPIDPIVDRDLSSNQGKISRSSFGFCICSRLVLLVLRSRIINISQCHGG